VHLTTIAKPAIFAAASILVTACELPVTNNLQVTGQAQQSALQNTQAITNEIALAESPDYYDSKIFATGFSAIAIQPSKNLNQRRLMAIRAAKIDAYRVLAEQIYGARLDARTTVAEGMLTSDVLSSAVRGTIMAAETVTIEPKGNDTYTVVLSISRSHLERLIKVYQQGRG
tara:strand:- start:262 stop:777 length:516 start_codon:yes stop_codon:yes gene_type:complete